MGHGYARGKDPVPETRELVICGETGLETIHVNAHGEPVEDQDCLQGLCHDCLRVVASLSAALPAISPHTTSARLGDTRVAPLQARHAGRAANQARAPPYPTQA